MTRTGLLRACATEQQRPRSPNLREVDRAWPIATMHTKTAGPPSLTRRTSETSEVRSARSASATPARAGRCSRACSRCWRSSGPASSSWSATTTPAASRPTRRPGQNFGLTLLWTLPLLIPVLVVNQEMVVRLGAVTGVGHARLINERFGRFWGAFSVGDLFVLNFLTIATEFIGVSLALGYFGVSPYISVPIAAVGLVAMTASGSFRRWERFMFALRRRELPRHPARHLLAPAAPAPSSTASSSPACRAA